MKKILAIGGSNSINSINRTFSNYVASLITDSSSTVYDLSQIDIPLFSVQLEAEIGIPDAVIAFAKSIDESDLLVLSLAENNGSFNAGFKNLMDWTSRIKERKIFGGKPMLLLATSPGARGGMTVLESAKALFAYQGATVLNSFSLPSFNQNFDSEKGIVNPELLSSLETILSDLK